MTTWAETCKRSGLFYACGYHVLWYCSGDRWWGTKSFIVSDPVLEHLRQRYKSRKPRNIVHLSFVQPCPTVSTVSDAEGYKCYYEALHHSKIPYTPLCTSQMLGQTATPCLRTSLPRATQVVQALLLQLPHPSSRSQPSFTAKTQEQSKTSPCMWSAHTGRKGHHELKSYSKRNWQKDGLQLSF